MRSSRSRRIALATCALLLVLPLASCAGAQNTACDPTQPPNLSGLGKAVRAGILPPNVLANATTTDVRDIVTNCNGVLETWIDGPAIFGGMARLLGKANHEIDMAFYKWDPESQAARRLGAGVEAASSQLGKDQRLLVRIVINDIELDLSKVVNNVWNSVKTWKINREKVAVQLGTYPSGFGNLHEKIAIVDGKYLALTGANPEKYHDGPQPWHDTGYHIQGPVVQATPRSFDKLWQTQVRHWKCEEGCHHTTWSSPDRGCWASRALAAPIQ
jgi:phosphatidylserine/phosphatidylglycerophosphate/cardiolipin synthase-like enzyme